MKTVFFLAAVILLSFSSCKKCVTCTPYTSNGTPNTTFFQAVKVCEKNQIYAYEHGTNYAVGSNNLQLHFICK